jgi:hypothetical protein
MILLIFLLNLAEKLPDVILTRKTVEELHTRQTQKNSSSSSPIDVLPV